MSVRVEVAGRHYTLSWEEYEKMQSRCSLLTPITILQIRTHGGGYVA